IYVVDLRRAVYYQKCHDPDCRGYRSSLRPIPVHVFSNHSVAIGSSQMLDDKYPVDDDGWGHQPDDNNKPNFLQYEDTVEDNSSDSWWLEAIKVVEDVENKQTATELNTKDQMSDVSTSSAGEDTFASGCKGVIKSCLHPCRVKNDPSPFPYAVWGVYKEAIDDGDDEEWWLAVERTASQAELAYTSTNSGC
ncbi:coiled-coil domain-containing protein 111, partial [Trifolium medium]|nr:coiled-coil domain-containing protein 111 [Trifolium medium]